MQLVLIVLMCQMAISPDHNVTSNTIGCRQERQVIMGENLTPYQCLLQAQPIIAKMMNDWPNMTVRKYTCTRIKEEKST